jgi:hypothetical protein
MSERQSQTHLPSRPAPAYAAKMHVPSGLSSAVRAGTSAGGQALDRHTHSEMSTRFGHDFSQVRIHTDACAGDSAEAMGANAYALGSDIVFGAGKYQPGSPATERLLAHELTHVVQQSQLGGGDWGRMSRKGDASEREADALASQVTQGRSVQVQAAPGAAIARDDMPDVPDTPSVREKEKPGGPTDWGDKGFSLNWDQIWPPKNLLSPKSGSLDIGQGDPFTLSRPGPAAGPDLTPPAMLPPPTIADPNKGMCTPNDPAPTPVPMGPKFDYTPPSGGGGLLGQPLDPSQPYGPPGSWLPSPIGPF